MDTWKKLGYESELSYKWFWCTDWCNERLFSPCDEYFWNRAKDAYTEAHA